MIRVLPCHASRRAVLAVGGLAALAAGAGIRVARASVRPRRIVHVMSFDSPWRWTDGQLAGFREGLGSVVADIQVFQMDVKRNHTPEAKERAAREARALIDRVQPELVYTSDDDALGLVARHYANSKVPFVFSGVNKDVDAHGLAGAANVTGVLEREHFVETVRLLRQLRPGIRRVALVSDSASHWGAVIERARTSLASEPEVRLVAVDRVSTYAEYQARIAAYPAIADAVVYLGVFNLADADGKSVPYQQVQRWTAETSRLPDASFWIDRVHHGVLASVTVSEREQGRAAGRLARAILVDGTPPSKLEIKATVKGNPAISLARAQQLGIEVRSSLLLSTEVVRSYEWDKAASR